MDRGGHAPLIKASELSTYEWDSTTSHCATGYTCSCWRLSNLVGRLTEVTGPARLSAIAPRIHEAQQGGNLVAWITTDDSLFFPPDFVENGICVDNIPIVRANTEEYPSGVSRAMRAAEVLLRTSAFIMVVIDLGSASAKQGISPPKQENSGAKQGISSAKHPALHPKQGTLGKALRLANVYNTALIVLNPSRPYLGSLVSLRIHAEYERIRERAVFPSGLNALKENAWNNRSGPVLQVTITAVKDKRNGPYWNAGEVCRAPNGMC